MAAAAVELAGLREHDGAVQPAAPVGIAEKVSGDGVAAVHLDDPVAEQIHAVAQVVPEIRFFQQQEDGRGGLLFPQPAVLIGIVCAVGTEDGKVVVCHPLQVGDGHHHVQMGVQPETVPVVLHIRIVGVAVAVDPVIKGIVDDRIAHGAVLGGEQGGRILQLRPGQGGVRLALGVGEQNAAQRAAAVSKAYHAVFRIHIDTVLFHKPLRCQHVQLRQRSSLTLFLRHSGVSGTVGQGGDGGIRLLHLLHLGDGQGLRGAGGVLWCGGYCRAHCREGQRNGTHCTEQAAIKCMLHFFFSVPLPRHAAGAVVRKAASTGSL